MTVRIEARPTARRELAQALLQWVSAVRQAERAEAHLYEDLEYPQAFCVVTTWPTAEAFGAHVAAPEFGSLVGAVELLAMRPVAWVAEIDGRVDRLQGLRRFGTSGGWPQPHDGAV